MGRTNLSIFYKNIFKKLLKSFDIVVIIVYTYGAI